MSDSDAEFEKFLQEVSHHKQPSDTPGERLASVFPESVYFQTLELTHSLSHTHTLFHRASLPPVPRISLICPKTAVQVGE